MENESELLFIQLISMFHGAAMQHLGKIKNPVSDKIEKDMEQAKMSIEILRTLKSKTKNNLTENELKFLDTVIQELQLNYVDEIGKNKPDETKS
ncbi:MAG: DUF1844 domain-containing protein [Bacteroidetes bacterium]|nr:DUF1844 domain-containing protein [Bacteroidota bacterium]